MVIGYSQQCNIRLVNDASFCSFKSGRRHSYRGGAFDCFPTKIKVPSTGLWNATIDIVTRHSIDVTRKSNFKRSVKFVRRSGS